MSEQLEKLVLTIAEVNVITESAPNEFVWIFYTFDEAQRHQLVYVHFLEADFLSAIQKCSNCIDVFTKVLMENCLVERVSEQDDSFESFCVELSLFKNSSIFWGKADYSAMFYNLITFIFKKGRD